MHQRDIAAPETFINALRAEIMGFRLLDARVQARLAHMVWTTGSHKRTHTGDPRYSSFSHGELEALFGRGRFAELNDQLQIFEVTSNWSKTHHQTKGYRLTESVDALRLRYLCGVSPHATHHGIPSIGMKLPAMMPTNLIAINGKAVASLPKALNSLDGEGKKSTAWNGIVLPNVVPVDMRALLDSHRQLGGMLSTLQADLFTEAEQRAIRYRQASLGQLIALASTTTLGAGQMAQRYVESGSGRLYASGVSLQNVPRLVRQAALEGCYDYDIENCHFDIFQQLAERTGFHCAHIAHYLANKAATRQGISERVGISIADAKACLLALMFGAKLSSYKSNAIPELIGAEKAKALFADPTFKSIAEDAKHGAKLILAEWPVGKSGLVNAMNKPIDLSASSAQKLAHIIQGIEAKALRACVRTFGDSILLPMHDGFVSSQELSLKRIEQTIYTETEFVLQVSGGRLALPVDHYFAKVEKAA